MRLKVAKTRNTLSERVQIVAQQDFSLVARLISLSLVFLSTRSNLSMPRVVVFRVAFLIAYTLEAIAMKASLKQTSFLIAVRVLCEGGDCRFCLAL